MAPRIIHVQAAKEDRRVAFVEEHRDHPNEGQAWVVGDGRVVRVALTANVRAALGRGTIVEVDEPVHEGLPSEELPQEPTNPGLQTTSEDTGAGDTGESGKGDTGGSNTSSTGGSTGGKSGTGGKGGTSNKG